MIYYTKQKQTQRWRTDLWFPRGREGEGGRDGEFGGSRCKLVDIQWIKNKVLQYSTRSYVLDLVTNHNGKQYEKECVYVCIYTHITESPCY